MKYFIDTEFKEYFKQHKLFGIPVGYQTPTIDLISIGIVAEDGREYYAINKDCDLKEVCKDPWLWEHVITPIYTDRVHGDMRNHYGLNNSNIKSIFESIGKSKYQIAQEILEFVNPNINELKRELVGRMFDDEMSTNTIIWNKFIIDHSVRLEAVPKISNIYYQPEFYAYYASYDWVVFCWIFGRMIDLPKGFPMYCKDLKQMMDDKGLTKEWKRINCPDPIGEHNALIDAKWNLQLYQQLIKINR